MWKKDDKVGNKTACKKKGKGKKKRVWKKNRYRFPSKSKFWLMRMPEKKNMLNYIQLAEI